MLCLCLQYFPWVSVLFCHWLQFIVLLCHWLQYIVLLFSLITVYCIALSLITIFILYCFVTDKSIFYWIDTDYSIFLGFLVCLLYVYVVPQYLINQKFSTQVEKISMLIRRGGQSSEAGLRQPPHTTNPPGQEPEPGERSSSNLNLNLNFPYKARTQTNTYHLELDKQTTSYRVDAG